jgi:hypothetical protein
MFCKPNSGELTTYIYLMHGSARHREPLSFLLRKTPCLQVYHFYSNMRIIFLVSVENIHPESWPLILVSQLALHLKET